MQKDLARDFVGYGRNPPDPRWPGNARVAVQFVVNFEEGGENNILHGDRASEAFLSDVLGAQPWPGPLFERHPAGHLALFHGGKGARLRRHREEAELQRAGPLDHARPEPPDLRRYPPRHHSHW